MAADEAHPGKKVVYVSVQAVTPYLTMPTTAPQVEVDKYSHV